MAIEIKDRSIYQLHHSNGITQNDFQPNIPGAGEVLFDDNIQSIAFAEIIRPKYNDNGTAALKRTLENVIAQYVDNRTPEMVIASIARNEHVMDILSDMWRKVANHEADVPTRFSLAVLHSQLPLESMNDQLRTIVEPFPTSEYGLETFTTLDFCGKSEGYLHDAFRQQLIATDQQSFIVKASSSSRSAGNVGHTGGVSTFPIKTQEGLGSRVIVPYVWYKISGTEQRDVIEQQIFTSDTFHAPETSWQVVRAFDQSYFHANGGNAQNLAEFVVNGWNTYISGPPRQILDDDGGVSRI